MHAGVRHLVSVVLVVLGSVAFAQGTPAQGASAQGTDASPLPRGQLGTAVVPQRYWLELEVDPRKDRFDGVARIAVKLAAPATRIWLHGQGLDVRAATIVAGDHTLTLQYAEEPGTLGVARLDSPEPIPAGDATLVLAWSAKFAQGAEGLYKVTAAGEAYAFTQMEPISARRMFPGFDDPQFKTPFEVTVVTPDGNRVVANAPLASAEPAGGGRTRHRFEPTLPLPTYLVALAVGPLDVVEAAPIPPGAGVTRAPLPLRGVATHGQGPRLAFALQHAGEIVQALEKYFGIAFPYPKLDLIASPGMGGAMENAGAIIFADDIILLAPDAPPSQLAGYYATTAHELAHHWFGDLVTPRWWDDIWLNESFAQWMGVKIARQLRPDLVPATSTTSAALYAMGSDSRAAGRPIREAVTENGAIASTFDAITYQKGGGVLAMIESYLGADAFRDGVRLHLSRHAHGSATADEFFAAMAQGARRPEVVNAFRSFVEQPGLPLVTAKLDPDGGMQLVQSRFAPVGSRIAQGARWKIPLCATFYGERTSERRCTLMRDERARIAPPPAVGRVVAVLPNADGFGYFRFALDETTTAALLSRVATLPDGEALVLADSIAGAFEAGRVPLRTVLDAAAALAPHRNREASTLLGDLLGGIANRILDGRESEALRARIAEIYLRQLRVVGARLDVASNASAPAEVRRLRSSLIDIVAGGAREPALRAALVRAAVEALTNPGALDTSLRARAWLVAVQAGEERVIATARTALTGSDALARRHAASALGGAREPLATTVRSLALDPAVRGGEAIALVARQFADPSTRDAALEWLLSNYRALVPKLPGYAHALPLSLPGGMCSPQAREKLDAFGQPLVREMGFGRLELDRALESIELCVALKQHHAAEFAGLAARGR